MVNLKDEAKLAEAQAKEKWTALTPIVKTRIIWFAVGAGTMLLLVILWNW